MSTALLPVSNLRYQSRIESIDLLRGVVIMLMALDHVRDFFGAFPYNPQDLAHVPFGLFVTRWITNFCAPTFMLLSGISAYLYSCTVTRGQLSLFLVKRGLFLILLELTVVSYAWTFSSYLLLQVIWALGASMLILSLLVWLPRALLLVLSLATLFLHNLSDSIPISDNSILGLLWHFLHATGEWQANNHTLHLSYPLLPWPAVMALGFCLGHWMQESVPARTKKFVTLGIACLVLFTVLRSCNGYGDPYHWGAQAQGWLYTVLSFLKVTKYPPSLEYVLFNLGVITLLWPVWEYWQGWGSRTVLCFGKVAMFFYLLHLPLIHGFAHLYSLIVWHATGDWWWHEFAPYPVGYHLQLSVVYIVWVLLLILIYPFCRWYKQYKETHRYWWLKYI